MKITTTQEVEVTPEMLAEMFCEMDDENQAKFFRKVADIFMSWDYPVQQCLYICKNENLGIGRDFIIMLHDQLPKE